MRGPLAMVLAAALLVAGCQSTGGGGRQSDLRATLSDQDVALAVAALQHALETADTGVAVPWSNPDTGNSGLFTPTRTFLSETGLFCREFDERLAAAGRTAQYRAAGCRTGAAHWRLVAQDQ